MRFDTATRWPIRIVLLLVGTLAFAAPFTVTPFHENGIYQQDEKAGWTIKLAEGTTPPSGGFAYTVKTNNAEVIGQGVLEFSKGSSTLAVFVKEPAMLYVEITGAGAPIHLGAAIAPNKLKPSVPRPADFDSFWEGKLKALSAVPIHPELTRMQTTPGIELHTVKLDSLGSHVQGYLAKPAKAGKFPALIIYQYAGVYALSTQTVTERAFDGWLAFDVDAHDLPPSQATGVPGDYYAIGNTNRETSYFLNMYLRDSRAINYIASRPDWDGKTLVIMGTSMGGQQSMVAAALNHKVTAVLVNEPSGADTNANLHGRRTGYPKIPTDDPKAMEAALYFDTVNFAPRIQAPVVAAIGFIDTIAPPAGIWTAMNQVPGAKEVIPMVESDHNSVTPQKQGAWDSRSREVLEQLLKSGHFKVDERLTR